MRATLRKHKRLRGIIERAKAGIKATATEVKFFYNQVYNRPGFYAETLESYYPEDRK